MTVQGTDTRAFDGQNRLVSATDGALTTQFAYGPDGARIKKTAGGATMLYFGDDVEVIPGATPQYTKYLPGDAKRVGLSTTTWLHRDHLRSVRAITNAAGAVLDRANYRPFGEQLGFATADESKGYIGERHDDETGLMYLHARYYDPVLARFIQADPMDPYLPGVGINKYSYVFNNPVMMLDPSGLGEGWDHDPRDESGYHGDAAHNNGGPTSGGTAGGGNAHAYPNWQKKYDWDQIANLLGIGAAASVAASLPGCDVGCGAYPAAGDYQLAMAKRTVVPIGEGWDLAIDPFNFRGQGVFEVHVRFEGKVVGTFNIAGEEIKQVDIELEKAIPQNVRDALIDETESRLRASGLLKQGETLKGLTVEQRMAVTRELYGRVKMNAPKGSILGTASKTLNSLSAVGMVLDALSMAKEMHENDIIREQRYNTEYY